MFLLWKLFKNFLYCSWSDGGSGDDGSSDDGGFGGDDGFGGGYGDYGGFAGGGSAADVTGNAEQNAGMGADIGFGGDTIGGGYGSLGVNTNIAPATETTFNSNMDVTSVTTNTISAEPSGYSITSNTVTTGYLDTNFDHISVEHFGKYGGFNTSMASVTGGTVASHLYGIGLSAQEAITAEAISKVAIGGLLGISSIGLAISVTQAAAQVFGAYGALSQKEYDNINMAVGIASAMLGALHTMQTISAITTTFGYMTTTQKALAVAISALSIKNTISSFQAISEKYGVEPSEVNIADIANIDFGDDSSITGFYEKIIKYTKEQQLSYGTNPSNWQLIDKMAGSLMFDIFMAGGILFNSAIKPTQILGSVGSKYKIPLYAKYLFSQEDYLKTTEVFNVINKIYEPDVYKTFYINNMI